MNRVSSFRATLALAIAFMGVNVFAQDAKKPADKPADKPAAKPADAKATDPKPAAPKTADKAPAGDKGGAPDMSAMMDAMKEMSAPGKEHEALKPMVGTFACSTKMMAPGQPPVESTGTVERKWILGNRYLAEEFKGNMMGMPFEGFGIAGYDKLQKQYHSYWVDSFGTGTWNMTGTGDASGKNFTFTGENFNPQVMARTKGRTTTEIVSNDKHVMKMYDTGPDGKEVLSFEMTCTRK